MADISDIISSARKARKIGQLELAALAGVSARTISNVEAGSAPSIDTLARITAALCMTDDERQALAAVIMPSSTQDSARRRELLVAMREVQK